MHEQTNKCIHMWCANSPEIIKTVAAFGVWNLAICRPPDSLTSFSFLNKAEGEKDGQDCELRFNKQTF